MNTNNIYTIDTIDKKSGYFYLELNQGALSMRLKSGQYVKTKFGVKRKVDNVKCGEEVYINLFNSKGKTPKMPSKAYIEKVYGAIVNIQKLPNLVVYN